MNTPIIECEENRPLMMKSKSTEQIRRKEQLFTNFHENKQSSIDNINDFTINEMQVGINGAISGSGKKVHVKLGRLNTSRKKGTDKAGKRKHRRTKSSNSTPKTQTRY